MRSLSPTPAAGVEPDGTIHFGVFDKPFTDLKLKKFYPDNPLLVPRLKEWQHFAFIHRDLYISLAVVNIQYTTKSWIYVFDRRTGRESEQTRTMPPGFAGLPETLWDGHGGTSCCGYSVKIHNNLERSVHEVEIDVKARGSRPGVSGRLELVEDLSRVQPLVTILPISEKRPMYTHKAPCPLKGSLVVDGETFEFDPTRDLCLIDVQKSAYPRKTHWNWATFGGFQPDGRVFGINLVKNMVPDPWNFNENSFWLGDKLSLLGPAEFMVPESDNAAWQVRTLDDRASLTMTPLGERKENLNLVVARSCYRQPVGVFSGYVVDDSGERIEVRDVFGVIEDHLVHW